MDIPKLADRLNYKKILSPVVTAVSEKIAVNAKKRYKIRPAAEIPDGVFDKIESPLADHFTAGFGKRVVMPKERIPGKKKYYVAGYMAFNPATGVLDPMMAKALWLDDNSGRGGTVFCSVDCVGLFKTDTDEIKRRLADFIKETGCRSVNICSTHDHAGIDTMGLWGPIPKSGRDPGFMEIVFNGVIEAIKDAYLDRRDGSLYLGRGRVPREWIRDSRLPQVSSDYMTRLRFAPSDGSREIYLANFASHSESLEGGNSLVSADFPAYIAEEVMRQKGAETVYFVGAIGGLIRMHPMDENNIVSTKLTGKKLGEILCSIEDEEKLEAKINILKQEFYAEAENPVLIGGAKIGLIPAKPCDTGTGALNIALRTEMTYIEIGTLKMLLIPGELFPELAYGGYLTSEESAQGKDPSINPPTLCDIAGDDNLLIFGLANDEIGYIPTPNDFLLNPELPYIDQCKDRLERNHYEETNSLGPNTAYFIADTFKRIMRIVGQSK